MIRHGWKSCLKKSGSKKRGLRVGFCWIDGHKWGWQDITEMVFLGAWYIFFCPVGWLIRRGCHLICWVDLHSSEDMMHYKESETT